MNDGSELERVIVVCGYIWGVRANSHGANSARGRFLARVSCIQDFAGKLGRFPWHWQAHRARGTSASFLAAQPMDDDHAGRHKVCGLSS